MSDGYCSSVYTSFRHARASKVKQGSGIWTDIGYACNSLMEKIPSSGVSNFKGRTSLGSRQEMELGLGGLGFWDRQHV